MTKRFYVSPQIEVVEIEIEGAILALSDVPGGSDWNNIIPSGFDFDNFGF